MIKERFQNPTCGDNISLRLFTYNTNDKQNIESISKVEIYVSEYDLKSTTNPEGLRLVQTIDGSEVINNAIGEYYIQFLIENPIYTIGTYKDVWYVKFDSLNCNETKISNEFKVLSDVWFADTDVPIYDFNFSVQPTKIKKGTKRYLIIKTLPNLKQGSSILPYYENLALSSDLKVSIEIECGNCVPQEQDLRLIVDKKLVNYKEKNSAYFFIDTEEYQEGVYNIWFELNFKNNVFISDKLSFQIF